ncbi:hypothetical protein T492DRAFT_1053738 [Pavlovales sp. CCMP2436]|nr:hypothetical protein T492DRAFT_1053738 [Pavlovales sp. CCMP2436]
MMMMIMRILVLMIVFIIVIIISIIIITIIIFITIISKIINIGLILGAVLAGGHTHSVAIFIKAACCGGGLSIPPPHCRYHEGHLPQRLGRLRLC